MDSRHLAIKEMRQYLWKSSNYIHNKHLCHKADMRCHKEKTLRFLMFLKEKRDETKKARGCADGRPQRIYTNKEDTSSPTVSIEAIMLSCAIDAKENRYVIVSDIPG
jgi:hypothetical protein